MVRTNFFFIINYIIGSEGFQIQKRVRKRYWIDKKGC